MCHYTDKKTHFKHIFESFCPCTDPLWLDESNDSLGFFCVGARISYKKKSIRNVAKLLNFAQLSDKD